MDLTPERPRPERNNFAIAADDNKASDSKKKVRKPPPVTPRRFKKFFTPRPGNALDTVRTSRKALRDITRPAGNNARLRNAKALVSKPADNEDLSTIDDSPRQTRKRKLCSISIPSSPQSSPLRRPNFLSTNELTPLEPTAKTQLFQNKRTTSPDLDSDSDAETEIEDVDMYDAEEPIPAIRPYRTFSTATGILSSRLSGRRMRIEVERSHSWQEEAANFYSSPTDVYEGSGNQYMTIPFSATSCNTNSLVAIGDEQGQLTLVDSASGDSDGFSKAYLTIKAHENALMDIAFSEDDMLIATASGDQTCRVIDVQTQQPLYCLAAHSSSVKRVQFQPGSSSKVLASCSRDGSVYVWDLRCSPVERPLFLFPEHREQDQVAENRGMRYLHPSNQVPQAHFISKRTPRKGDKVTRCNKVAARYEFVVTSLAFMGPSRSNMIVTASEADSVIKLWDIRTTYGNPHSTEKNRPVPVSSTKEPNGHTKSRPFGLTSLAFSGDGSRLYALCRDHSVYAYSTSHLILGSAPEISKHAPHAAIVGAREKQGVGPMYAFRHQRLFLSSFYPKIAVRTARDQHSEMLAVGSSEDCAVLFPTDERYLTKSTRFAPFSEPNSGLGASQLATPKADGDIPIYGHGTALIRGHTKEVTAVTWTSDGHLVTSSDDFTTRVWREDEVMSRDLRTGGETEGRRWKAGWATVYDESYDE